MFTGIIEEIGNVKRIVKKGANLMVEIRSKKVAGCLSIGQSISINGVCLTAISFDKEKFYVEATKETQEKSNIKHLKEGDKVNLERAVAATGRFDGHFVLGHADGEGILKKIDKRGDSVLLSVEFPETMNKYVVNKGSITMDGISLTVVKCDKNIFTINVIPHTFDNTNIKYRRTGDKVNIEFDVIGKYVEKMKGLQSNITEQFLKDKGFIK